MKRFNPPPLARLPACLPCSVVVGVKSVTEGRDANVTVDPVMDRVIVAMVTPAPTYFPAIRPAAVVFDRTASDISEGIINSNRFASPNRSYNFGFGYSHRLSANNDSKLSCTPSLIGFFHKTCNTSNIIAKYESSQYCNFQNLNHKISTTTAKLRLYIYNTYEHSQSPLTWQQQIE